MARTLSEKTDHQIHHVIEKDNEPERRRKDLDPGALSIAETKGKSIYNAVNGSNRQCEQPPDLAVSAKEYKAEKELRGRNSSLTTDECDT
jgi:hypothetical protein